CPHDGRACSPSEPRARRRFSLQVFDDADEGIAGALLDQSMRVQKHLRPANRVAFVAPDAEGETLVGLDINHDDGVGDEMVVLAGEVEVEMVVPAVFMDDVADAGRVFRDPSTAEDAHAVQGVLYRLVDEDRVRHRELELRRCGPGLLDAPRDEDGRPGNLRATAEGKSYVLRPLLDLAAKRLLALCNEVELVEFVCSDGGEFRGEGRRCWHCGFPFCKQVEGERPKARPQPPRMNPLLSVLID